MSAIVQERVQVERWFFVVMAVSLLATNIAGFTYSFITTDQAREFGSDWVKVHATAFALWVVLFFVQSMLVATGRVSWHRNLGLGGAALVVLMIGLTIGSATFGWFHTADKTLLERVMLNIDTHVDGFDFAVLAMVGLSLRRSHPGIHKRLMFLATVAVAARFPFVGRLLHIRGLPNYWDQDLYVALGVLCDLYARRTVSPAYIFGGPFMAIMPPLSVAIFKYAVPGLVTHP